LLRRLDNSVDECVSRDLLPVSFLETAVSDHDRTLLRRGGCRRQLWRSLCDREGLRRLYGGILSTILVIEHGFSFAIGIAGIMAIAAGLIIIIPLKFSPPVWNLAKSGAPGGQGGDVVERTV
jgi:hypothetical protein